jgi:two-component system CheB/CheR fusion protein
VVNKELREMCIFSQHSVIKDAPFSRLDLISCRNLLIYLNPDLQDRVIPLFHFALRPGGYLFLGTSENVTRHTKLFHQVDRRHRLFQRQESMVRVLPDFPIVSPDKRLIQTPAVPRQRSVEANLSRAAERIAERFAPAYVVIDKDSEVLHFSGRTGRYLSPASGAASLNLLNLVHPDLRLDLRAALTQATASGEQATAGPVEMEIDGKPIGVTITVEPVHSGANPIRAFVVLFRDIDLEAAASARNAHGASHDESLNNLEVEQELQSVNEELQTVNGELAQRVQDLAKVNSDLKNLLESTQIATIFLDNDLRIKNFTPAVSDIFHVIETDLGRPITHIAGRINYPDLEEDVRKVLRTLNTIEREVDETKTDTRYLVRVLPYRSIDNFIAGVVLTFLDVTATARAEKALRESEERYRAFVHATSNSLFRLSPDGSRLVEVWGSLLRQHSASSEPSLSWLTDYVHPDDKTRVGETMERAFRSGRPYEVEHRGRRADGSWGWILSRAVPVRESGKIIEWLGTATDISGRKQAEEAQQVLISELQHRTRNLLAVVRSISQQTMRTSADLDEFAREFSDRLAALSRVQGLLSKGDGVSVTLGELVRGEIMAHGAEPDGDRVAVDGPEVPLSSREVQVLTLALHELATNAAKHGALARDGGRVVISWKLGKANGGAQELTIRWKECGVPLDVAQAEAKRGFGRELIERALPYDLGARTSFSFGPDGVSCELRVPLNGTKP